MESRRRNQHASWEKLDQRLTIREPSRQSRNVSSHGHPPSGGGQGGFLEQGDGIALLLSGLGSPHHHSCWQMLFCWIHHYSCIRLKKLEAKMNRTTRRLYLKTSKKLQNTCFKYSVSQEHMQARHEREQKSDCSLEQGLCKPLKEVLYNQWRRKWSSKCNARSPSLNKVKRKLPNARLNKF